MIPRYEHPAVTALWSTEWTLDAWWQVEQAITRAQIELNVIPTEYQADALVLLTNTVQPSMTAPRSIQRLAELEAETKHDVAAFLAFQREWWGEPHARWIHYGCTSSDIVDTTMGLRFARLAPAYEQIGKELEDATLSWLNAGIMVLGRTHGMPAEPTAMKVRAAHWVALIRPALVQLLEDTRHLCVAKLAGPVGTYAHTPPGVEQLVAEELGLAPQAFGASQIVPRGHLGRWANSAAELVQACAKVAMDIRLMATLGEVLTFQSRGQVGSSSMAHKNNPIRAEQVTGLARLAAGYASMLQPLDLWLERDISHSCVERIAVPDLWHTVLLAVDQTTTLLNETRLNVDGITRNLEENANAAYTHHTMLAEIQDGMDYAQAREFGLTNDIESYDIVGDSERIFMANYPKVT